MGRKFEVDYELIVAAMAESPPPCEVGGRCKDYDLCASGYCCSVFFNYTLKTKRSEMMRNPTRSPSPTIFTRLFGNVPVKRELGDWAEHA